MFTITVYNFTVFCIILGVMSNSIYSCVTLKSVVSDLMCGNAHAEFRHFIIMIIVILG